MPGGGELPYITIRGRAEIWGILFAHYNPDFWVVLGRFPHVRDCWVCFESITYTNPSNFSFVLKRCGYVRIFDLILVFHTDFWTT